MRAIRSSTSASHTARYRGQDAATRDMRLTVYSDAPGIGGAEVLLSHLLATFRTGIDVTVLATSDEIGSFLAAARPGSTLRVVRPVRGKIDLLRFVALRRAIARSHPDIFHANLHSLHSCQYALAAAETIRGIAVVAVEHSLVTPDTRLASLLKRWTSCRLSAHVAVCDAAAREVERRAGLPPHSVHTIHNGVPDDASTPLPRVTDAPVIGTIARLDPIKGLDVALEALASLAGVHLVIAGNGPEMSRLVEQADRLHESDRVHFLGWTDRARDLLGGFDVFVLPSRSESFPLTVIEAMLAGRAVVATSVGSVAEAVIDGVTGLLVPPEDPLALGAAVESLLSDPARRAEMGRTGRDRALEHFDVATMARSYEDLYADVIGRHR